MTRRCPPLALSLLVIGACRHDAAGDGWGSGDASEATGAETTTPATNSSGGTTDTSTGEDETSTSSTGPDVPPPEPLCDQIAVSLVLDRQAPVYDATSRADMRGFFDALVAQTGAQVQVFPSAGTDQTRVGSCGPFSWGKDFEVDPAAPELLDCSLDAAHGFPSGSGADGDWMFSGLMFPILEHPDWPPADTSLSLAMLLADSDDDEGGMYARPGMTAEAFVRLAGGGDRRRVAALAMGEGADELHTFAVSVSEHSAYHDASSIDLGGALQTWLPQAVEACAQSDFGDIPQPPGGCQHIDILFVIDGSLSMAAEQDALRGIGGPPVFADFTDALALELDTLEDFRVAVVSSEPGDHLLHTHRDQPAVTPSPETDCGLPKGAPWIVGPSATLEQDFACLAATRASSTSEITAANAGLALADPLNAGFVREDAVLFVVMITDEDTQDAAYDFERIEIRQHILDAVGGDLARVVVLGIAGDQGVFEMPKTTCSGPYGTASPGRRLSSIVHSMREQGIMQDICGGGLAEAFGQALDDLVDTCNDFHPEG